MADQITIAVRFLEFLVHSPVNQASPLVLHDVPSEEDEEISEEEEKAVDRSKEWFKRNEGIPMEPLVAAR